MTAGTLAQFDTLLPDSRVEVLRDVLGRELRLPDEVNFTTHVQPERWANVRGVERKLGAQAVFLVTSPNPHERHGGETIRTHAATALEHWREKEDRSFRIVRAGDPAAIIFKMLCAQHMDARRNWVELN